MGTVLFSSWQRKLDICFRGKNIQYFMVIWSNKNPGNSKPGWCQARTARHCPFADTRLRSLECLSEPRASNCSLCKQISVILMSALPGQSGLASAHPLSPHYPLPHLKCTLRSQDWGTLEAMLNYFVVRKVKKTHCIIELCGGFFCCLVGWLGLVFWENFRNTELGSWI